MFKAPSTTTFGSILLILIASVTQNCSGDETNSKSNKKEKINSIWIDVWLPSAVVEPLELELADNDQDGIFDPDPYHPEIPIYIGHTERVNFTSIGFLTNTFVDADIQGEQDDHILCFEVTNNIVTIVGQDEDSKGRPVGLQTDWTANGVAGNTGEVKITLRHQPGTKTGDCSEEEEIIDFQITIPVKLYN